MRSFEALTSSISPTQCIYQLIRAHVVGCGQSKVYYGTIKKKVFICELGFRVLYVIVAPLDVYTYAHTDALLARSLTDGRAASSYTRT